jgi:formylglycine-generating enzyme required for sulfatase activity
MKRIIGIAVVLGLVGALTVMAQEVKPESMEVIDLGKGVKLEMVLIPAGKFMMGATRGEVEKSIQTDSFFKGRSEKEINKFFNVGKVISSEMPKHEVTITQPYYMSKYEVTQEQLNLVMGGNSSSMKGAKFPVTDVSWNDCQYFIDNLNKLTNGHYKLPSEAEWEYACRAGTSTAYSFGDKITKNDANFEGGKFASVKQVGSYKSNAFGLYDMHGNVWEWCEDWFGDYSQGSVADPTGPTNGQSRTMRGGSFDHFSELALRSSSRYHVTELTTSFKNFNIGFRLAKSTGSKLGIKKPEQLTFKNVLEVPFTEANAKIIQKETAAKLNKSVEEKELISKEIHLELVLIPAGKFKRGSNKNPVDPFSNLEVKQPPEDETPLHEVVITKPYYMGRYEVTQEQWFEIMGKNPSRDKARKFPVTMVSWNDCQDFIKKLNAKTSGGYRLPTEAEWEFACRAGTTTAYSYGDILTEGNISNKSIIAVGSYRPNVFGLYDMHGNVCEWCEDRFGSYPAGAVTDPKGPVMGGCVKRGGGFLDGEWGARSSTRSRSSPSDGGTDMGFRLAKTP